MPMKLIASSQVAFDVRFTLNEQGAEVEYGFRAEATRTALPDKDSGLTVGTFLTDHAKLRMTGWLLDDKERPMSPLVDEATGQAPSAGPEALSALYELLPTTPGVAYAAYIQAIGAKAKTGN